MPKVVFVSGKDPVEEVAGGHSSYVWAHGRAAIRLGYEPHIFCASSVDGEVDTDFGIVHQSRSPYHGVLTMLGGATRALTAPIHESRIAKKIHSFLLGNREAKLIHGFGPWAGAAVRARQTLAPLRTDLVLLTSVFSLMDHEYDGKARGLDGDYPLRYHIDVTLEQWWIRQMIVPSENRTYRGADCLLVNYESVRSMLVARFGDGLRIRKVAYSSATAFRPPQLGDRNEPVELRQLQPRDAPLIVALSRQDPRKGIHVLLQALASLKESGIAFRACIVGGGQLLEEHRRLARVLAIDRQTLFTGVVKDPDPFLRAADVFVLASLEESSGSVSLIEALQAGVACVTSATDGIPEDVVHECSALLTEPGSVDSLAAALQRVVVDKPLRERLRRGARAQFEERFSAEEFAASLKSVYEEFPGPG